MRVDMFERLPTPFGLVRFGVAPDHPEVKRVINDFGIVAATPGFRFFGNVEVGSDISLETLRRAYDAVVVATGAQGERLLNIPGEDLHGVVGAPAFVKWYNGHPDFVSLEPAEPGESVVVVGQGNVALDIARVLTSDIARLQATDIHRPALARFAAWQRSGLRAVHIVGRRGFVQAAFTNAELRELLSFSNEVLPIVDPSDLVLSRNPASEDELAQSRMKKRTVRILETMAENFAQRESTSKRIIWLRFLLSPSAVLPSDACSGAGGIHLERMELSGEPGNQVAVSVNHGSGEDIACGLIVRSVGFDLIPIPELPMEGRRVPHLQGRVEPPIPGRGGLYICGWAKNGPRGIIATNIADAAETTTCLLADLKACEGELHTDVSAVESALMTACVRTVDFGDWRRIEAEERRLGADCGASAVKLTDVGDMLRVLDSAP